MTYQNARRAFRPRRPEPPQPPVHGPELTPAGTYRCPVCALTTDLAGAVAHAVKTQWVAA